MHYIRILEHTHKNNFWAIVVLLCEDPARIDLAPLEIEVIIVIIILPLSDRCAYFFVTKSLFSLNLKNLD